jgi:hypothetical protein
MTPTLNHAPVAGVLRPNINEFVAEQRRLPRLGDAIPPWEYRGWLLWYCQLAHLQHSEVINRWGYYFRTVEAGCLLDEPIPQIKFQDCFDNNTGKMLRKAMDLIYEEIGSWSAFSALIDWFAWGLAVSNEKPPFSSRLDERLYRHVDLGPLLLSPHDYLGSLYCEGANRWNPHAFYPTPHSVAECMVQMTMHDDDVAGLTEGRRLPDGRDPRTLLLCDPAVGSGRMLLHGSNFSLCLYGVDIDPICCRICAINGALYAPWLAFPFPAAVLGVAVPPAAPAEQPMPLVCQIPGCEHRFRVDDRGQGRLFEP